MVENKKPEVRFNGFNNAWEQRKLSELTSVITKGTTPLDKSGNGDINFIKIENIDSCSGEIIPEMKITEAEHNGYLKRSQLQENDILFSIAGTLGRVSIVKSSVLPANTNQALAIIRTKEGDLSYLTTVLKGNAVAEFIKKNPTIGAQPNLSLEQVGNLEIPYPSVAEQEAIGEYFSNLDHLITLHQREYDKIQKIKKSMLHKMFPKEGSNVPEIRFKGFTGAWEQRKLSELLEKYEDPVDTPSDGYERVGIRSHAKGTFHSYVEEGKALEAAKMHRVAADKFILNITFAWEHAVAITDENDAGKLVSHRFPQFSFDEKLKSHFFKYLMLDKKFREYLELCSPGGAGRNRVLKISDMLKYEISLPSIDEQSKIGEYFDALDDLITLHQRELEKLKNVKKSCLEKMFV